MSEDLKVLQPGHELVLYINGAERKVEVKPFKTGQLLKVIRPVSDLAKILRDSEGDILELISLGGDKLIDLVCLVTNLSRSEFEELEIDQAVDLITAIVGENRDFFEQKLVPAITRFKKSLSKPDQSSGEASTQG